MILNHLKIHHLRNIISAELFLNARFNFIYGANGSGKTSILESLYLLSCAHSFRSREIIPIVTRNKDALAVFARTTDQSTIAIQKSIAGSTQIKLNNQFCTSTSQLAYALPCQIIYADIFQIIDAGPTVRRSLLDWGLFHVKPNFLLLWKEYKRVLKQRNALLRTEKSYTNFIPWDKQLDELACHIHQLRQDYFADLTVVFHLILKKLTDLECDIDYYKGWDKKNTKQSLLDTLVDNFDSDRKRQYTQSGVHQADILISSNTQKAKQVLSRGQQKIILMALKLAQGYLIDSDCLYLIDDLSAELDKNHQIKLFNYLETIRGQFVISNIDELNLPDIGSVLSDSHTFCIANGIITHSPNCSASTD